MKQMTCEQFGGGCNLVFTASTFDEMAAKAQLHAMEMFQTQDEAHLKVIQKMQEMMQSPGAIQQWFSEMRAQYDALSDID
tara:strand:- start:907 stop:1146 length:240 start_codon:yes stop_codon:yes gene_type:complete